MERRRRLRDLLAFSPRELFPHRLKSPSTAAGSPPASR
jgi:hypothetical protein